MRTEPAHLRATRLRPDAILPTRAHPGDAGLDLYAVDDHWLASGKWSLIPTGIALQIPHGYMGDIRSRSGLGSWGIVVGQGVGTIDAAYRGEVKVNLYNRGGIAFRVNAGDRIAQLVITPVALPAVVEVEELDETARAADGFGSSGR